jgi:hypothetical protein
VLKSIRFGYVRPTELLDHALRKGDKLLLHIYEAHEQKQIARISDNLTAGKMLFSVAVTLGLVRHFPLLSKSQANYIGKITGTIAD